MNIPDSTYGASAETLPEPLPACQVCGRQDETLRLVRLPYVFSLVFVTIQRNYTGLWCRRHRTLRWLLAAGITSVLGWLGLPFGLLYTPLALFKLAQGGDQPGQENARLLFQLAEHKLRGGDLPAALRCLEASLHCADNSPARDLLRRLNASVQVRSSAHHPALLEQALWPLAFFGLASALGLAAGFVSYTLSEWFFSVMGEETSILLLILGWVPLVASSVLAVILLRRIFRWMLERARITQAALAVSLAAISAGLFAYCLLGGRAFGEIFGLLSQETSPQTFGRLLAILGAALTRGGLLEARLLMADYGLFGLITLILVAFVLVVALFAFQTAASHDSAWQRLLAELRVVAEPLPSSQGSWAGLIAGLLGFVLLFSLFPQKSTLDYLEAYRALGLGLQTLNTGGVADQALGDLTKAASLDPDNSRAHQALGWAYYLNGEQDQAVSELQRAAQLSPSDLTSHIMLGRIYLEARNPGLAGEEFRAAIRLDPAQVNAYLGLGQVALLQQDIRGAEAEFLKALAADPQSSDALLALGSVYQMKGEDDRSVEYLRKSVEAAPESGQAHAGLGAAYLSQHRYDQAQSELEQAVQLDPGDAFTRYYLAQLDETQGKWDSAVEQVLEAEALEPDLAYPHALLARMYFQSEQPQQAGAQFEQARSAKYLDSDAWYMLGMYEYLTGQNQQAEQDLRAALDGAIEPGRVYEAQAANYSIRGQFEQALKTCQQVQDVAPPWRARLACATVYIDMGSYSQAQTELETALKTMPGNSALHASLSLVYYHQGQNERAVSEAQEAVRIDPYNNDAYRSLAFAQLASGRPQEAIAAAQEALKLVPRDDLSHYALGMSFLKAGQAEQARQQLQAFLAEYWDRPYVRQFKKPAEEALASIR